MVVREALRAGRKISAISLEQASVSTLQTKNDSIVLKLMSDRRPQNITIPLVWFRDHCRSEKCYNATTNQRKSNLVDLFQKAVISSKDDVVIDNGETLRIKWIDGHVSTFDAAALWENSVKTTSNERHSHVSTWSQNTLENVPRHALESLSFSDFARDFVRFGVSIVDGVSADAASTEKLCREIAPIHDTYFGSFWVFSNDSKPEEGDEYHEDTAYGNEGIGPHTDGTYFNQTPGIQVFHCLHPARKGGDTVLVDGWNCAEVLREKHPDAFRILTTTKIDHHYIEGEGTQNELTTISTSNPVIQLDENGEIHQIRFNPYDRALFRCSSPANSARSARDALDFYKAYAAFSAICHDESNSVSLSLQPGSVIFIDNFRVFHARTEFEGYRQMCGCYLSRDNFLAKARPVFPRKVRRLL